MKNNIDTDSVNSLAGLFSKRAALSADETAFVQYDAATGKWIDYSWSQTMADAARWQRAMQQSGLQKGDRVAVMLRNCREWVLFDQAALGLGLVTVPIYTNDRAGNIAWLLKDAGVRLLLIEGEEEWRELKSIEEELAQLDAVITLQPIAAQQSPVRVMHVDEWLQDAPAEFLVEEMPDDTLATIIYTSGTTGHPKGVMLSHRNILFNVNSGLESIEITTTDRFLSFLPLSHAFERSIGYYLPIAAGSSIVYARSIPHLAEDLQQQKPTVMIAVPRIFERIYSKLSAKLALEPALKQKLFRLAVDSGWARFQQQQGVRPAGVKAQLLQPLLDRLVGAKVRGRFGGRLRFAVCGGAALSPQISRLFIGLGIPVIQGYGLTEHSPTLSVNRVEDNIPASIGRVMPGMEVVIGEEDEIVARSPSVMLGYWNNEQASAEVIDQDGWLHTGDKGRFDDKGHLYITGRLKEILVLSNGEKVPPADIELAIATRAVINEVLLIGDARPYLSALIVPEMDELGKLAKTLGITITGSALLQDSQMINHLLTIVNHSLADFPGYARVQRIALIEDEWSVENGMLTPTLKLKRGVILEQHKEEIDALYAGH
ncbi:MAG: long-chain fatty acid--CoA ligase [Pseudomonadota bacterium]|nr:long-chain fatty acid--CoA ligase [Pseudomonadota bacterium]